MATASIDAAALDAAERFVLLNARLLERHRFAHLFRGASGDPVVAALLPYANPDGGFGHALEPDLRGVASQPEPVEVALRVLHETEGGLDGDAAFRHPMTYAALDYLAAVTAPDGGVPYVLPTVVDGPRAWWWEPPEGEPQGALVPTASIAGLLHAHGLVHPWVEPATEFCRARIEAVGDGKVELGPYEALAVLDLLDHVPDRDWAEDAFGRTRDAIMANAALDPDTPGHVKMPLDFAPDPGGFGRRLFDDATIERHLDRLVADQADDGGWGINWEPWAPATVNEWRGHTTIERLKTLRAYGRWSA